MPYESVDKLQKFLATQSFAHTNDRKKAAGRALGTFIEIVTFYLLKTWGLEQFIAIERPLEEYANPEITHNVEFTLHGSRKIIDLPIQDKISSLTSRKIYQNISEQLGVSYTLKNSTVIDKNNCVKNACTIAFNNDSFLNVYTDTRTQHLSVQELCVKPFAMFECKRVGVEEGHRNGPQTIEKAKQGSYVARTVSALQRIRKSDGSFGGYIQTTDGTDCFADDYYELLNQIINSEVQERLKNVVITVGVISNHGNWFTSEIPNKELKVLAQSYDWLLFLTDKGLSEFITDLLLNPEAKYLAVKEAFDSSYGEEKKKNVFTKVQMDFEADKALCQYFQANLSRIESWINIISPKQTSLNVLKNMLLDLSNKHWWRIYQ